MSRTMSKAERSLTKAQRRALRDEVRNELLAPVPLEQVHPALAFRIHKVWAEEVPADVPAEMSLSALRRDAMGSLEICRFRVSVRMRDRPWSFGCDMFLCLDELLMAVDPEPRLRGSLRELASYLYFFLRQKLEEEGEVVDR